MRILYICTQARSCPLTFEMIQPQSTEFETTAKDERSFPAQPELRKGGLGQ